MYCYKWSWLTVAEWSIVGVLKYKGNEMCYTFIFRCLAQNGWEYQKAGQNFLELHVTINCILHYKHVLYFFVNQSFAEML